MATGGATVVLCSKEREKGSVCLFSDPFLLPRRMECASIIAVPFQGVMCCAKQMQKEEE